MGGLAVQLFFSISGFVFFWLFAERVAAGSVSVRSFAVDRFCRLYPLHLLTLIGVAVLQGLYSTGHGSDFVYPFNDAYHALLNLLLAPAWGFEQGWSYNAPIWSVSIEVLLYASFFIICLAIACGAGVLLYPGSYKIGSGLLCFFAGGLAYGVLWQLRRGCGSGLALVVCGCIASGAWATQLWLCDTLNVYLVMGLCFPATLALLAAAGLHWPGLWRSTGWIGDISYSSYLLHFPLQIVFALVFDCMGFDRVVFYQPWVMLSFFMVLLPMSLACHRWVERPAQRWLRNSRLAGVRRPGRVAV